MCRRQRVHVLIFSNLMSHVMLFQMDMIKWGHNKDSAPDFALNSYCWCLGYQAAYCMILITM